MNHRFKTLMEIEPDFANIINTRTKTAFENIWKLKLILQLLNHTNTRNTSVFIETMLQNVWRVATTYTLDKSNVRTVVFTDCRFFI